MAEINFNIYNYADGISDDYKKYYYDKPDVKQTINYEKTYNKVDEIINSKFKIDQLKNEKNDLLEKLKKTIINLEVNNYEIKDDIKYDLFTDNKKNFRFVNVNDNEDYTRFLFERKLYEFFKDNKNYINEHYFKDKEESNKELYNITNVNNYNNIVKDIDNEEKNYYDDGEQKYVVLKEVQYVIPKDKFNEKFNIGLNDKKIAKCYLFDYVDNDYDSKKTDVETYVKEKVSQLNNDFFINFNNKDNKFKYENLNKSKILNTKQKLNNDFEEALIKEIMKNYKNNKIEHFMGIYYFIKTYEGPPLKLAHLLSSIENLKSDNVLKIAYNMNPPEAKQEGGSSFPHIASLLEDRDLEPGEKQFSQINATGGSAFPRIASLLAASQINMPPLLSPISSFYEKYIKYKSKYLKLQKIKSLKY